jgi:hypothetical protein
MDRFFFFKEKLSQIKPRERERERERESEIAGVEEASTRS